MGKLTKLLFMGATLPFDMVIDAVAGTDAFMAGQHRQSRTAAKIHKASRVIDSMIDGGTQA